MRTEVTEIDRFYRSVRGEAARAMVMRRLEALWPDVTGLDIARLRVCSPLS